MNKLPLILKILAAVCLALVAESHTLGELGSPAWLLELLAFVGGLAAAKSGAKLPSAPVAMLFVAFLLPIGCAHAPGALGTARCLLNSPAVDAMTEDPGYAKSVLDAKERVEQAFVEGKQPEMDDLSTLAQAAQLAAGLASCGAED